MSLKRLGEATDLLVNNPDHAPDPFLMEIFQVKSKAEQSVICQDECPDPESPSCEQVLTLHQVQEILLNCTELSEEVIKSKVCPALLKEDDGLILTLPLLKDFEQVFLVNLILPWIELGKADKIPTEVIQSLNATSQKKIVEKLLEETKPNWTILAHFDKLDMEDERVQTCIAAILVKQGPNKDVALARYLISLLKSLPRSLERSVYELWSQAVSMHQTFLSKSCASELKKISV